MNFKQFFDQKRGKGERQRLATAVGLRADLTAIKIDPVGFNRIMAASAAPSASSASLACSVFGSTAQSEEKVIQEAEALINDDGFITEVSGKIGKPTATESEEEFVARSKSQIMDALRSRLFGG